MAEKLYHKLVRDKIPEIIRTRGGVPNVRTLSEQAYHAMLRQKLVEETREFLLEDAVEELADILEVVYALAKAKGVSIQELERMRDEKALERGAFQDKILLISVEEGPEEGK